MHAERKEVRYPYMLAKRTSKNQLTLPKPVADQFPAVEYFDVQVEGGRIVLRPVQIDQLDQVRVKLDKLGIRPKDVAAAVEWARASKR